jgi:hypothetical protein
LKAGAWVLSCHREAGKACGRCSRNNVACFVVLEEARAWARELLKIEPGEAAYKACQAFAFNVDCALRHCKAYGETNMLLWNLNHNIFALCKELVETRGHLLSKED